MTKVAAACVSAIALGTLAVSACDKKVDVEDELLETEAVALLHGLVELMADSTIQPIHASEDSIVVRCTQGGRVKFVGGVKEGARGDTALVESDFMITPSGCKLVSDGLQFTVDGDAGVRQHLVIKIWGGGGVPGFDIDGSFKGGLKWMLDSRSGDCAIDLTLEPDHDTSDPNNPVLKGVYKGGLCGYQVEVDAEDFRVT